MSFLNDVKNFAEGTARLPIQTAEDFSNTFANLGNKAAGRPDQTIQQNMGGNGALNSALNFSQATGTNRQLGGDVAQVGLMAAASAIAGPVGEAVSPLTDTLGTVAGTAVKGAAEGAAINAPMNVAQGVGNNKNPNAKNLGMDFLQGAGMGAAFGGVLGGAGGLLKATAKPAYALDDETAQAAAKEQDPDKVEKILEPKIGPVAAKDVAPAVAKTSQGDPAIVKNIVQDDLNNKLSTSQQATTPVSPDTTTQSPAPAQMPPTTSVSDINTPQQVAQQGSEATQNFMNAPKETPQPAQVSKLGSITDAQNILNTGGTIDEAVSHYMNATGSSYGESQAAINKMLRDSGQDGSLQRGNINASLNPEFESASKLLPKVTEGDNEQPIKNAQAIHNEVIRRANIADAELAKLSPADLKLADSLRQNTPEGLVGQAEDRAQFLKAGQAVKSYNDFTQGVGSGFLGQDVAYRQNYGAPQLWDNTPEGQAKLEAVTAKLKTNPMYGKQRFLNSYEEGEQQGLTRRNDNFRQDVAEDANRRANDLSQLALAKGFEEAHPGQVKIGDIGATPEGTYKQLLIPGGQRISLPSSIANEVNERAPAPDAKGVLAGYDRLNGNWKNLKLAGGGFHSVNVTGSYVAQQIASGNFIKNPGAIADMVKATLSDNAFKSAVTQWGNQGRLLDFDAVGLQHSVGTSEADIKPSGKLGNIPILKQIHSAIFDRQIPYMKMQLMDQKMDSIGFDRNNPDQLKEMSAYAKNLNNAFGGLNRSIQGLTPGTFNRLQRVFLATDYNEGQIRLMGNAFKEGGSAGTLARQVVLGKALLWAGMATAGGVAGGEFKGQTPRQVALNILAKVVNPKFKFGGYTVGLPTSQLSELGKPISETVGNAFTGKSLTNPTKDFASARLAAIPSGVEQWAENRNFSGQPLRGTDYYGRPISAAQTAEGIAGMAAPIPIAQGIQTASGSQSTPSMLANIAGVRSYPTSTPQYAPVEAQTYLQELQKTPGVSKEQLNADTQFVSALGTGDTGRSKVLKQATSLLAQAEKSGNSKTVSQNRAKVTQLIADYNKKLIQALKPWQESGGETYLDANMLNLLRTTMISFKNANENVTYDIRTNPTSVGVPIAALASAPQPVNKLKGLS
jgi:hypothetical protein